MLQSIPENFGANEHLGESLAKLGNLEEAIPPLQKAAKLEPDKPMPHIILSDVYSRLGREENAEKERAEAERLGAVRNGPVGAPPDNNPK